MNRREFLQAGIGAGIVAVGGSVLAEGGESGGDRRCVIVRDPADPIASSPPAEWAARRVRDALASRGVSVVDAKRVDDVSAEVPCVIAAGRSGETASRLSQAAKLTVADSPELLGIASLKAAGAPHLLAVGADPRGLAYALSDLADTVALSEGDPLAAFHRREPTVERPANRVRGIGRLFCSDVEDKPWYNDRGFWQRYLDMLASQRFNRFHLALGLGYDVARGVKDSYFYFPYPFLLPVPGYDVRATGLPDAERDRNLEILRHVGDACAARGIDFQLGLWCHQHEFADSPAVNHRIEGLNRDNHANYCRDALAALLKACPNVAGVTFRIHGESGIAEGSYGFWRTVFDGVVRCGRKVGIELHAKGSDPQIIDIALATGMSVTMAPKYWAEHTGLPYIQTAIRGLELPHADRKDQGFFAKSSGSRSFTRYGYADLLAEDRHYDVVHRMWPGTQRLLLWGDPVFAAAYGRASSFCGSGGAEIFEPMSFKGRLGSGLPGGRQGYADESLKTDDDWEKYRYSYTLWGRLLYNPDADPEVWRRVLRHGVGTNASASAELALANASRILPMVTTANSQSASYNAYWVEMSWNMPIVDPARRHPYGDTPSPKRFGTVSPLDPQLFLGVDAFADQLLRGNAVGDRYTPAEVAAWLEKLARSAGEQLEAARAAAGAEANKAAFRRMALDVQLQAAIGLFFAQKLRAAVLWALFQRTGDADTGSVAVKHYRTARDAWAAGADKAKGAYAADVTYGTGYFQRGHWLDRLAAIDQDIADMDRHAHDKPAGAMASDKAATVRALVPSDRPTLTAAHTPPPRFRRGQALTLTVRLQVVEAPGTSALLHYRRVNQAEAWQRQEMTGENATFHAAIPANYTDSPFPLQYYFELRDSAGWSQLFPGLNNDWSNQPYYVVRQSPAAAKPS